MAALLFNALSSAREAVHRLILHLKKPIPSPSSSPSLHHKVVTGAHIGDLHHKVVTGAHIGGLHHKVVTGTHIGGLHHKVVTGAHIGGLHHEVVTGAHIGDRPVLIVGDIHGCYDEFLELIKAGKEMINDREMYLVCAGDMLNKGPKNKEVLVYLRDLINRGLASAVKGNHEEAILRQRRMMCKDKGYALPETYQYLQEFSDDDFAFIEGLPYSVSIPHLNAIIVHAGLVPGVPLHRQSTKDLCEMRNVEVSNSRRRGRVVTAHRKPTSGVAWATLWQGPEHVYFGHDCRRGLQQLPFATGLDTGCVYGGKLTGVLLDGQTGSSPRLLSVAAARHRDHVKSRRSRKNKIRKTSR